MLPAMAGGTLAAGPAANEAAFELDRIEWTDGERIEVEGRWLGVRGRRFVRPTLTLRGPGGERRMLALLEHKPWDPGDEAWLAAFAFDGEPTAFDDAELAVAPGLEVVLPAPRQARKRAAPAKRRPKRYGVSVPEVVVAPAPAAQSPAAAPIVRAPRAESPDPAPAARRQREATALQLAAERATVERLTAEIDALRSELGDTAARLERESSLRERLEGERDEAAAAREAADRHREALETELESARRHLDEARETGVQRDTTARDEREALRAEGDAALRARKAERDTALRERDAAFAERDAAIADRDALIAERDAAVNDRDSLRLPPTAVSLPRSSIYTSTAQQSLLSMWTPRLIAVGLFIAFVVVVLLLFHA